MQQQGVCSGCCMQEASLQLLGRPVVLTDWDAVRAVLLQTPEVLQLLLAHRCDSSSSRSTLSKDALLLDSVQKALSLREASGGLH